jgi:hypothetical protein
LIYKYLKSICKKMDPKELRGLYEAYSEVYAPQEEIGEAVKGADPEMRKAASAERRAGDKPLPKGEGEKYSKFKASQISYIDKKTKGKYIHGMTREEIEIDEATAMAKRGYDEAPIRQKIAKSTGGGKAADRASALEKKPTFGDANKQKQRERLARAQRGDFRSTTSSSPGLHGYAHKSDDPGVKAKQAARGAQRGALTPAEKKQFNREEFDIFDVVLEFLQAEGFAETLEEAEWMMANVIDEEAIGIILGEGKKEFPHKKVDRQVYDAMDSGETAGDSGNRAKETRDYARADKMRSVAAKHGGKTRARTNEEFVDEAQEARNNPEKYEREQSKKYAPVRGEKTPMPPRGDKRREDFEKWYAKQMGR